MVTTQEFPDAATMNINEALLALRLTNTGQSRVLSPISALLCFPPARTDYSMLTRFPHDPGLAQKYPNLKWAPGSGLVCVPTT